MSLIEDLTNAINIQQERKDREYREMMQKPLQERVNKGHTLTNLDIEIDFYDHAPNDFCPLLYGDEAFINRVTINCGDNVSRFREGTIVQLSHGTIKFVMTIEEDRLNQMVLVSGSFDVKNNHIDRFKYPRQGWEINEENTNINQRLLYSARDRISLDTKILRIMEQMLEGIIDNDYSSIYIESSNNQSQDDAIRKSLGCTFFHIIQGPPGTGKTYTIAKITKKLLENNNNVFVTAPTHTAINTCLNAISKEVPDKRRIIKIGERNQADEIVYNSDISRKTRLSYDSYRYSEFSQNGIVIGATPYALCYPASKKLEGWDFDYVIIDEAAQMSIPLALAAMAYGKKIIFVGDHKQLDPIMPTGTNNWLFAKSVFKHMIDKHPQNYTMLNESYRLSKSLVRIPSLLFYGDLLKSALRNDNKEFTSFNYSDKEISKIINDNNNDILYLHHEFDSLGRSPYEAILAAGIVKALSYNDVDLDDIAIITPYRAQVREIRKALFHAGIIDEDTLDDVFVDTIERMQGQEKDYVIFSLANSNPSEVEDRLEFFYSPNRLNVAITRAKIKCIVIANKKVFELCENVSQTGAVATGQKSFWDYYKLAYKMEADDTEEEW